MFARPGVLPYNRGKVARQQSYLPDRRPGAGRIMHELSITESVLNLALEKAREANVAKITRINLVTGELSGVVAECIQFYFDIISKDTVADGAELSIRVTPTMLHCDKCDKDFSPTDGRWTCPTCNEIALDIVSGRECYMESLEVE